MNIFITIINSTLIFSLPIMLTGFGGLFSERSGVANIALEGLMMIGAFVSATITVLLEKHTTMAPWIAIIIAAIMGTLVSSLHAYVSITMKGDQIISATALNFLALGSTVYFSEIIFGQQHTKAFQRGFSKISIPILEDIPILGKILFSNIYLPIYVGIILMILVWFIITHSTFGLRLRATGEHPHAVDSAGISVSFMRYSGVLISGFFAGLAGGIMVLTQDTQYSISSIHGTGFMALAALIFGRWNVWGVTLASLLFGFSQILVIYSKDIIFLNKLPLEFFKTLPYILTIATLILFSKKSVMPKSLGIPYEKGSR